MPKLFLVQITYKLLIIYAAYKKREGVLLKLNKKIIMNLLLLLFTML